MAIHGQETLARARTMAYRPLIARSLLARGRISLAFDRGDRGAADFAGATQEAIAAGDDPLAIEAYARRAWAAATAADPARASDGAELVLAMTERTGDRAEFERALLHHNLGGVALARGDRPAARAAFERTRRDTASLGGSHALELTSALVNLLIVVDDPGERAAVAAELIATRTRLVGANHPLTLEARTFAAQRIHIVNKHRARVGCSAHHLGLARID